MTGFDPKVYRNLKDGVGSPGDPANTDSTSSWTMVALLKGIWAKLNVGVTVAGVSQETTQAAGNVSLASIDTKLSTINLNTDTLETLTGIVTETAPASDTASSGLNGRLQRVAQRITSLIALVPASLGTKTAAASFSTTLASDDPTVAVLGTAADAASTTTTVKAALRGISTALGITALDLGTGTGGSRTLRSFSDTAQWVGGAGALTSAVQRVAIADISNGEYETVAASQTAQALGPTGATGDYISGILVIPATTSPGLVTLLDNATSIPVFVGGATSVSNLVPFFIPLGMISVSGAWKITTGANVSCIGIGNFT